MFGRMSAMPIARLDAGKELHVAVAELLAATDYPEIGRWIQFPRGLMLFLLVPGDARSGAVYVYDRCDGIWYWVDFQDENYGGYDQCDSKRFDRSVLPEGEPGGWPFPVALPPATHVAPLQGWSESSGTFACS